MLNAPFIAIVLLVTALLGGGFMAYQWLVKQRQLLVAGGIATLAGMRWREFSRFVIEALQAQGFDTHPDEYNPDQTDLRLTRDGQTWLLSCKQGAHTRITSTQVGELVDAVRLNGAAGGILVTLGTIEASARKASDRVDMFDGQALWPLIDPLLPPSVHTGLRDKARATVMRTSLLGWVGALAIGFGLAMLLAPAISDSSVDHAEAPAIRSRARAAAPAPATVSTAAATSAAPSSASVAPLSDEEQRKHVIDEVGTLPGIESVIWSTRSTLLVHLTEDASQQRVDEICAVLKRYDQVRTSRLHLQPPRDSQQRVRFLQCATF